MDGDKGDKGMKGLKGQKGEEGQKGVKGDKGATGKFLPKCFFSSHFTWIWIRDLEKQISGV